MKVRATKGVRVIDPSTRRPISETEFVEVEASRYWRRRLRDGAVELEPDKPKSSKASKAEE